MQKMKKIQEIWVNKGIVPGLLVLADFAEASSQLRAWTVPFVWMRCAQTSSNFHVVITFIEPASLSG